MLMHGDYAARSNICCSVGCAPSSSWSLHKLSLYLNRVLLAIDLVSAQHHSVLLVLRSVNTLRCVRMMMMSVCEATTTAFTTVCSIAR